MEKVLWVTSSTGFKTKDGLTELNSYLENGWSVKLISACAMGDSVNSGQAYVVIEKQE